MNKILNINLGGYALTIDDDAYEYLQAYIESIRRKFSESEGRDEIVSDIEARLGELISQSMGNRTIVMRPDVEAVLEVMGKPEEFDTPEATTTSQGKSTGATKSGPSKSIRTGKRLFRDEDDSVVSGVCSGLAAYFGLSDPLWMRLIFVLLAFISGGFWVPTYLLLWILIPPARSAADRLAMRGEPINVDNIAREVEDGFDRLSNRVNQFGSDANAQKNTRNALNSGVATIGQIFGFMVRFIGKFAAVIAILIAIGLFLGFAATWIGSLWSLIVAAPFISYFSPFSTGVTWLGVTNAFFLIGIPLVGLMLMFTRVLFKTSTPRWLGAGMTLAWVLNLISLAFITAVGVRDFRQGGTLSKSLDLNNMQSDTLRVEAIVSTNTDSHDEWWFSDEGIRVSDGSLELNGPLEIRVVQSKTNELKVVQTVKARGRSNAEALENAEKIAFNTTVSGNTLGIPTFYQIGQGNKWRGQWIKITIELPVGKTVVFDRNIYHHAAAEYDEYSDENDGNYISKKPERYFKMTNSGLMCTSCPNFGDANYDDDDHYENFTLEGNIDLELREGDDFKMRIDGPTDAIQKIRSGNKLTLISKRPETTKIYIETRTFTSMMANNTGEITIRGFDEGRSEISAKGTSKIRAFYESNQLDIVLTGQAQLELTGRGNDIDVSISDSANLDAINWRVDNAEVSSSDLSKARLNVKNSASVISDGTSQVKIEGGAEIKSNRN